MKINLEHVLNNALDGIFIIGKDGQWVLFNQACKALFGISKEELAPNTDVHFSKFEKELAKLSGKSDRFPYGELSSQEETVTLSQGNGRVVRIETTYSPIIDKDNHKIAYILGIIKDITEWKPLQENQPSLPGSINSQDSQRPTQNGFAEIVGRSPGIQRSLELAVHVAPQNTTVALIGESGTGKELFARAIHNNSGRASKPFIAINCSAFPDTLIESELFGYEKGAFTGAYKDKPGKVRLAAGGTLFLDEVNELSPSAQTKLLRVIQEREFEPLGSVKTLKADIRIIISSNQNLEGTIREDLFYRLYVYPITIPPLRERREDLPLLIDLFLEKFNRKLGKSIQDISTVTRKVLFNYSWPGNVRELQNVLERVMILTQTNEIQIKDIPENLMTDSEKNTSLKQLENLEKGFSLEQQVEELERTAILKTLMKFGFNKSKTAKALGLTRATLRYKLSKMFPAQMRLKNVTTH